MSAWADNESPEWVMIQQIEGLVVEAVALADAGGLDTLSLAALISGVLFDTQGMKGDL